MEDHSDTEQVPAVEDLEYALFDRLVALQEYGREIEDQAGAFHQHFYNVLSLTSHTHPHTVRLISLAMSLAATIGMHWKIEFRRPRPAQVWPGLLPFIPTPAHPSFPSNHATQAYLIAILITQAVGSTPKDGLGRYLHALAECIGLNRERAGVHFKSDTFAGAKLAEAIAEKAKTYPVLQELMAECKAELSAFVPEANPEEP